MCEFLTNEQLAHDIYYLRENLKIAKDVFNSNQYPFEKFNQKLDNLLLEQKRRMN